MEVRSPAEVLPASDKPARLIYLDLMKTMLVYGMITAHVIQLLWSNPDPIAQTFSIYINFTTFTGFMLAFGIGIGASKHAGAGRPLRRRLRPALVLLLSTYLSSFAFIIFVRQVSVDFSIIVNVITLRVLVGYSEFLASFFVLYLLSEFCRDTILRLCKNLASMICGVTVGLLLTAVQTSQKVPVIGTIIGSTEYATFPLASYSPWLFLGCYIGQRSVAMRPAFFVVAGGCTLIYYFTLTSGISPSRFPPQAIWIIGPAFFLVSYIAIARAIASSIVIHPFFLVPGRYALSFLLGSNLMIFVVRYWFGPNFSNAGSAIAFSALIVVVVFFARDGWQKRSWRARHGAEGH